MLIPTPTPSSRCDALQRWMKFNLVSAMGVLVQLGVYHLLARVVGTHYLVATALAVEAAILHNFAWHERVTWSDRSDGAAHPGSTHRPSLATLDRLLRFNLTTGAISIIGNVASMSLLVGQAGLPFLAGHLVAIGSCSIFNFLVSDRFVFRSDAACHARPAKISTRS